MLTRRLATPAIAVLFALATIHFVVPARVAAQDVAPEEGWAYRVWYDAAQAGDVAKATEAARTYLGQYPEGQYAESLKKWLGEVEMAPFNAAIKEKRVADVVSTARTLLAGSPDNLLVLYQAAFTIWSTELIASPARQDRLADAVEFVTKAMPMIEAGQAPAGSTSFDKDVALAWMHQVLALNAAKDGKIDAAIELYGKSTALAPGNAALVTRNLFAVFGFRQTAYGDAVKAFKALPEADQQAPDAKPEVKAALDLVNSEADAMVDAAAAFVAFTKAKGIAAAMRDRVNTTLETVYKSRHPEDADLAGLQKVLQDKEAALGVAAPATGN